MTIEAEAIRAGDVLLFHGKGFLSWAIRVGDGTEVNHAAIALGDGVLAEAGGFGLQSRPVPIPGDGEFFRVHRLDTTEDFAPVTTVAQDYLDNRNFYAYQQIVLLAALTLLRRLPMPRVARRLVRAALDHAAGALMDLLPVGKEWMICSEYVYRAYVEAVSDPVGLYDLSIAGISFATAAEAGETLLDWAIANAHDVELKPPVTFGGAIAPTDPLQRVAAIEADLAPLIADYAQALYEAGELPDEADLPPVLDPSFGPPPDLGPEPTDDELIASAGNFAAHLLAARGELLPAGITFGGVGATVGATAIRGALEGMRTLAVRADFITPGDLLKSPSLRFVGRLG
jgi:hypothetical protein